MMLTPKRKGYKGAAWLLAATVLLGGLLVNGGSAGAELPLKACADPDNLPFSSSSATPKGFYLELADRLANAIGRTPQLVWHLAYFGKSTVRNTLLARECDLYIGLPADGEFMSRQVIMSEAFAVFRYALVLPRDLRFHGVADLRGRRVAVQFSSPPQNLLATADDVQMVTVLSPEEGMRALAEGRADVAYLWGPSAGYLNKYVYADRYEVIPTEGPAMSWHIAIGFRRADVALRDRIQQELDGLGPWIGKLEAKYGFPGAAPVRVAARDSEPIRLAAAGAVTDVLAQAAAPSGKSEPIADTAHGRELFNSNCGHCHGQNAESPESRTDLRKLRKRYGTQMEEVFETTVHNGRPDKGMPLWKGVISEGEIASIKGFIDSVQQSK